jgi:hypothetical protein
MSDPSRPDLGPSQDKPYVRIIVGGKSGKNARAENKLLHLNHQTRTPLGGKFLGRSVSQAADPIAAVSLGGTQFRKAAQGIEARRPRPKAWC